jgi:hypothetical protein
MNYKYLTVIYLGVGIATGYRLDDRGSRSSSRGGVKNFLFSTLPRPALGSTQPPIQWVPDALSPGESGQGVKLTTHLQLVPRSRKCGSIHPLPHTPSWRNASLVKHRDNFTFTFIPRGANKSLALFPIFLFAAQPKEFFLDGLKKLEQRSHKCVELRGEYVE